MSEAAFVEDTVALAALDAEARFTWDELTASQPPDATRAALLAARQAALARYPEPRADAPPDDWHRHGELVDRYTRMLVGVVEEGSVREAIAEPAAETSSMALRSFRSFKSYFDWPDPPAFEAFHGIAGEIVRKIGPHSEADPVALLAQMLVGFGNAVGRHAHICAEADKHFPNLFVCVVGETAKARKGSSFGQAMHALALADLDWRRGRILSGLSSGEGLTYAVRDGGQSAEDGGGDVGVQDKRLLVYEPEFASVLRVLERQGNTLSPVVRQAWDTGDLGSLVKHNPTRATGAHISIIAHITLEELRRYLNRTETANGFANRFLLLVARRSKCLPESNPLPDAALSSVVSLIRERLVAGASLGELRRDDDARVVWHAVYPTLSEGKPGLLGAAIARAEAQVMRLATVYALLDGARAIGANHLLAALALWDYAEASARHIFGESLGNPLADELLGAIRACPEGLTRTAIRDLLKRNRSGDDIGGALTLIQERGLAHAERVADTGGRPAERWHATTGTTTETTLTTEGVRGRLRLYPSYLEIGKRALQGKRERFAV